MSTDNAYAIPAEYAAPANAPPPVPPATSEQSSMASSAPGSTPAEMQIVPRKRKIRKNGKISRWGPVPKRRRWGLKKEKCSEGLQDILDSDMDAKATELHLLKMKLQETMSRMANPLAYLLSVPENERSPSPQPIYDPKGNRLNTREFRLKKNLAKKRDDLLQRIMTLNPDFKPPSDWKPPKVEKKIYVPQDEYPDYNFFGLIIGPRGMTQKRMQKETGCKIAIRGKGSFVEGKANRIPQADDNEPMHVLITGPDQESVERAGELIKDLLVPVTETENELKAKQLRVWAEMNQSVVARGTCRICGGAGHPVWKCPERSGDRWTPANVQCAICGELSHVTADCKLARGWSKGKVQEHTKKNAVQSLEDEYQNFMKELTTGKADQIGPAKAVGALTNITASSNSAGATAPAAPNAVAKSNNQEDGKKNDSNHSNDTNFRGRGHGNDGAQPLYPNYRPQASNYEPPPYQPSNYQPPPYQQNYGGRYNYDNQQQQQHHPWQRQQNQQNQQMNQYPQQQPQQYGYGNQFPSQNFSQGVFPPPPPPPQNK